MSDELTTLIMDSLKSLDSDEDLILPSEINGDTPLFGKEGLLDSMALVTLVVAVEQAIEDKYGVNVSLADAKAMSQKNSPYRTVGFLAEYAQRLIEEEK